MFMPVSEIIVFPVIFMDYCALDEVYVLYSGEVLNVYETVQTISVFIVCNSDLIASVLLCKYPRGAGTQRDRGHA